MGAIIENVVVDCADAYALGRWWSEVLARPLSPEDLGAKFRDNVAGRLGRAAADAVRDGIAALRHTPEIGAVLKPLSESSGTKELS